MSMQEASSKLTDNLTCKHDEMITQNYLRHEIAQCKICKKVFFDGIYDGQLTELLNL